MKAILLAAGHGTRLGKLTLDRPKVLVPVAGEPLLERQLRYLETEGAEKIAVNVHAHADQVREYLLRRTNFAEISIFHEPELLGSAGGVKAMEEWAEGEPVVVLYGDVLLLSHGLRVAIRSLGDDLALIAGYMDEGVSYRECGVMTVEGNGIVTSFVEKPIHPVEGNTLYNSGLYVLSPELFDFLPAEGDFATDIWPMLAQTGRVRSMKIQTPLHVGSLDGLREADTQLYLTRYFEQAASLCLAPGLAMQVEELVDELAEVRASKGRVFVIGVGGGAGNAAHAVNDLRKVCEIEAYAPTDNASELTARANDDGWETVFSSWLGVSQLGVDDALLVFSVSGGSLDPPASLCLVEAIMYALESGATVLGITAPGGFLAKHAHVAVVVEPPDDLRTPLTEAMQAVVWHAAVTHPTLEVNTCSWEARNVRGAGAAQA